MELLKPKNLSEIRKEREQQEAPLLSIGQQLVAIKISDMQKDRVIQALGQQLVQTKLEVMKLKGGET